MIEFHNIEKSFFGVKVLKGVSFAVAPGQTLGIVGENGAGKSTLMNILGGNIPSDSGTMSLDGKPYTPKSPRSAEQAGIAFIHQELNLFPNLSIAENIFVGSFPSRTWWLPLIDRRKIAQRTRELLQELKLNYPPETPVEVLSAGERQLVEIAKAIAFEARLIIFDEPTTSLTAIEMERFFAIMRRLRDRGISMIYISHNLGDVMRLCDRIMVLRDGAVVANEIPSQLSIDRMVTLMVGREITQLYPEREGELETGVVLEVRGLSQPCVIRDITFDLRRGEILGLAGLMGSGRSELARILFGLDPCAAGEIRMNGERLNTLTPRERIERGLAFLTEDRRAEGLCLNAAIADNLTLASLPRLAQTPFSLINEAKAGAEVSRIRQAVKLTPSALGRQEVKTLSGGNQQKVVLAKWLLNEPKVFILDEPTRGIDVGAKQEVYRLIRNLAAQGAAVLMISSEVEELIGMCDRILVMRRGVIRDMIMPGEFDRERILRYALHDEALP